MCSAPGHPVARNVCEYFDEVNAVAGLHEGAFSNTLHMMKINLGSNAIHTYIYIYIYMSFAFHVKQHLQRDHFQHPVDVSRAMARTCPLCLECTPRWLACFCIATAEFPLDVVGLSFAV